MTGSDEFRAHYLASGPGDRARQDQKLDLIRSVLGDEPTWMEPPPEVVDGLLGAITRETIGPDIDSPRDRTSRWPVIVAAVGAAAAVIALVLSTVSVLDSEEETLVAMSGTDLEPTASGSASVLPTGSGWWIRLDLAGLPPAPQGSYYEGWVWSDDGEGVSIGTFHLRGGDSPVILWSGVELADYPSIWVTIEDEDEGPEASGVVVMTGRVPGLNEG